MNQIISNPLEYYQTYGKETHTQNVERFFDSCLERSGVDIEANRIVAQNYEGKLEEIRERKKNRNLYYFYGFLAFSLIFFGFLMIVFVQDCSWFLPVGLLLIALGGIWFGCKLHPALKEHKTRLEEMQQEADRLLVRAQEQLAPLEMLFGSRDGLTLIEQTVPQLVFHDSFTSEHHAFLRCFDFPKESDGDASAVAVLSGTWNGSPFAFLSERYFEMHEETYTNSKTIYWTEEEVSYDSDGNRTVNTIQRSQELTASYTADKPYFYIHSALYYGHETAPELIFSRKPRHTQKKSSKRIESEVRSKSASLQRKSRRAVTAGESFTMMANEEFEVLFGAKDRNNEQQFRLLFTPLAQTNMLELLKDDTLVGDEFTFHKNRKLNRISCADDVFRRSPARYHNYSIQQARECFVAYHQNYFRMIFGSFAPLLAIPQYQQAPSVLLQPEAAGAGHFSVYEHEEVANRFPKEYLVTSDCKTDAILKTRLLDTTETGDLVEVRSYGFAKEYRTKTFRFSNCGDGETHYVDVEWIKYLPREKTTAILIEPLTDQNAVQPGQSAAVCVRGLFAKIINNKEEV